MPLPIGFFMPLPLPIMIPFMMWQSAAIAAGFGTYFQFAKRRVSAMSNEDFNKADPHELVNSMYEDIVQQIPSSFAKVDSLTPVMLQSMNVMLDQAVKWLQGAITGNFFGTPNPVNDTLPVDEALPAIDTGSTIDSQTILSWDDAKFRHEVFKIGQGTSSYNQRTQQIILSLKSVRDRPDVIPPEQFEPKTPISSFPNIIIPDKMPGVSGLWIKRLKATENLRETAILLANYYAFTVNQLKSPRLGAASIAAFTLRKNSILKLIRLVNTNINK